MIFDSRSIELSFLKLWIGFESHASTKILYTARELLDQLAIIAVEPCGIIGQEDSETIHKEGSSTHRLKELSQIVRTLESNLITHLCFGVVFRAHQKMSEYISDPLHCSEPVQRASESSRDLCRYLKR